MSPEGLGGSWIQASQASARPQLPSDFVAGYMRHLIMTATAQLIAEHGYNATKVADITRHAAKVADSARRVGISRRAGITQETFYELFEGKEEVFLAVIDKTAAEAIRRVETACAEAPGSWAERIEAGLAAFLGHIAEQPVLARVCFVEAPSATPATTKHYEKAVQHCVQLARRTLPHDSLLPDTIAETLVGGVMWIVYQQVRRREAEQIEALLPQLSEFVLAPYVGAGVIEQVGSKAGG